MTTPYRNEKDVLRERKENLEGELSRLRAATSSLEAMRAREAELARELADVAARLDPPKRALPLLDQVKVASPCPAAWADMVGDDRTRFCLKCEKNVFNLSAMTRESAEALLREKMGDGICVRFYQRADGTIMTQDCSVGVARKRRRTVALAVAGAGAMALAAATAFRAATVRQGGMTMGAMPVPVVGEVEPTMPMVQGSVTPISPPAPEAEQGRMVLGESVAESPAPPKPEPKPKKR